MLHRAIRVEYEKGTKFKMTFQDGKIKSYDMARLFDRYPEAKALKNRKLFKSGKLNVYGIIWNDNLDIDADTVYEFGEDAGTEAVPTSAMIAYAVTTARLDAGLTQKQLALATGIDQADISKIECGVANPSIATLDRIAKTLGKTLFVQFLQN